MKRASVIIPAHDEAAAIDRVLESLQTDAAWEDLEVVVVCNGCRDDTATRATAYGPVVGVVETPVASKANALNLGDRVATTFPRVYLDADVVLSPGGISALVDTLDATGQPVGALPIRFDMAGAGRLARWYHETWSSSPHFGSGHVGAGLYALSAAGRARFDEFPGGAIDSADDLFVMRLFQAAERAVAPGWFAPGLPRTVRDVIRVRRRHLRARRVLVRAVDDGTVPAAEPVEAGRSWLLQLARRPRRWPALATFVAVTGWADVSGRWREWRGAAATWERDASTHDPAPRVGT